jgi:hypothetical protein
MLDALFTVKHGKIGDPGQGDVVTLATPNCTFVVVKFGPLKFVPVIVMELPPAAGPELIDKLVMVAAGGMNTYRLLLVSTLVPLGVFTLTWMVSEGCAGVVAVMLVEVLTVKQPAELGHEAVTTVVPQSTSVAPVNPVPPIATPVWPPAVGPLLGETEVTVTPPDAVPLLGAPMPRPPASASTAALLSRNL